MEATAAPTEVELVGGDLEAADTIAGLIEVAEAGREEEEAWGECVMRTRGHVDSNHGYEVNS